MQELAKRTSVPSLQWNASLATGLAEIDAQHKELFAIANDVRKRCEEGEPNEEILIDLSHLRSCAVINFDTEEDLMATLPISTRHKETHENAHVDFIRYIDRIARLLVTQSDVKVGPMLDFLFRWIVLHVSGTDDLLAKEIFSIRAGIQAGVSFPNNGSGNHSLDETVKDLYTTLSEQTFEILELTLQLQEEILRRKQAERDVSLSQMWIRAVADQAHSWEYWQGPDNEIIYMSPSCEQITGYTVAEFTSNPDLLYKIIHPEDRHLMDIHLHYVAQHQDDGSELDFRIVRRDGDIRWVAHSCKAVYSKQGKYMGRRGSRRDRTERYREEESLRMAVTVFDVVNEAVLVSSRDNKIVSVNPSFTSITGYQSEEVIGKDPRMLADNSMQTILMQDLWRTLVRTGSWQGEVTIRRKNGKICICWLSVNSVRDDAGHVSSFVSVFSDITERKESEQRIHYLAHYDVTTGLPNRALFNDRLRQSVLAAKRYQSNFALLFIDLDKFKPVNDRFGHDVGDQLLKEVALRVRGCIRESDTAARIGGDEFVLLLPGTNTEQNVVSVAQKVLQEIEQPFEIEGHSISISASIGIAVYPEHGDDVRNILKHADHAMYQAKHGKGPSIVSYSELRDGGAQTQQELSY
jgi:diguanylate cyclase (GGDEF)-like protein/PAS domain S-box-containing protein/hemerythrin-like metal-binding protein